MNACCLLLFLLFIPCLLPAQVWLDVESGLVATATNDVRITGSGGTFFSFPADLGGGEPWGFYRLRAGYRFAGKGEILLLYAPLQLTYKGTFDRDINFRDVLFPAGSPIEGVYKFNSYRFTYRYYVRSTDRIDIGLGLTLKVRDARISLRNGGSNSERPDLGAVPLINFHIYWKPAERLGVMLDGDALAVSSGRAEDVMLAIAYSMSSRLMFRAGYRILEGGADNKKVYTFSMFHYGLMGLTYKI